MNDKTKKILFILPYVVIVILVAVIIWMASIISSQGGVRPGTVPPQNTQSQQPEETDPVETTTASESVPEDTTLPDNGQTQPDASGETQPSAKPDDVTLTIPEMWQEHMRQEQVEDGNGYKTVFYCEVNGARVELFAVCYGVRAENAHQVGTLQNSAGEEVQVSIQIFTIDPGSDWTQTDITRATAMQEEINTILGQLQALPNFTSSL